MAGASRRRVLVSRAAGIGSVALILAVMIVVESRADPSPKARALRAAGALSISNSRSDRAVLSGRQMLPGDAVSGTVTITNSGARAGLFQLSASGLTDTPGQGGGVLSDDLRLVIEDVTSSPPAPLYDGALGDLGVVPVGEIRPSGRRVFRFTVTRPPDSPQSAYRAATTRLDFIWTALPELSGHCANQVLGSAAADTLSGSHQSDAITGGAGDDHITGGPGEDCLSGQAGNDVIDARDGEADRIDCGPGVDTVSDDPQDSITGCEHILSG